ncbi:MAG: hypothetical protein GY827_06990 [Cytophagales bacterium]|nr:hypothetical protein [Cytophagales bacterium]
MVIGHNIKQEEANKKIDKLLGESFSIFKKIVSGTDESKVFSVQHISPHFRIPADEIDNYQHGIIEMRPNGILVHLMYGVQKISWAIPYYQLVIYKSEVLSFHAQGYVVKFHCNEHYQNNLAFIDQIMENRNEFLDQYGMLGDYYG